MRILTSVSKCNVMCLSLSLCMCLAACLNSYMEFCGWFLSHFWGICRWLVLFPSSSSRSQWVYEQFITSLKILSVFLPDEDWSCFVSAKVWNCNIRVWTCIPFFTFAASCPAPMFNLDLNVRIFPKKHLFHYSIQRSIISEMLLFAVIQLLKWYALHLYL